MRFPIVCFRNNVVFNRRGEAFALYRLASLPYRFLPREVRALAVRRFEEMLYGFSGRGLLLLLCEELRPAEAAYLAAAGAGEGGGRELAAHARAARIAFSHGARRRRRYLALELPLRPEGEFASLLAELREAALGLLSGAPRWDGPSPRALEAALAAEEELFRRVRGLCPERAGWADLDFIARRAARRLGPLPPPLPSRGGGRITPADVASFAEGGYVVERPAHLEVRGQSGSHVQAFVALPDLPPETPETGAEWLAALDDWAFPVDAAVHFRVTRPHRALERVRSKYRFFKGQAEETLSGAGELGELDSETLGRGRSLEAKVASGMPLVELSCVLAVAGEDAGEAGALAAQVCERFSAAGFRAVRPLGDQLKCLYSFIPGSDPACPWVPCDAGYLAAAAPFAAETAGDPEGFLLGWSGAAPVFWKPGRAARELNATGAVLAVGSLGGGKSMFAKTLAYLARLAGGFALILDPKDEYRVFKRIFPETAVLDLSPRGGMTLNPFFLSPDPARAKAAALDYLSLALNVKEDNEARRVAVTQAVERTAARPPESRNLAACLEELRALARASPHPAVRDEAGQCVLLLEALRDSSLGGLVFGRGAELALAPVTVVNLAELPLPRRDDAGRVLMTESERQGLALVFLAAAMAREAAFRLSRDAVKAIVFDEAWMLMHVPEGARLLSEIVRMGRSYNLVPVLLTQNASDVADPAVKNNVGYAACFRASSPQEIAACVELLGADPEEARRPDGMLGIFPRLESGRCFFRDAEGRIALVQVDPRPSYLLEVFDTRPGAAKKEVAADASAGRQG